MSDSAVPNELMAKDFGISRRELVGWYSGRWTDDKIQIIIQSEWSSPQLSENY